jgi:hypothetical protein
MDSAVELLRPLMDLPEHEIEFLLHQKWSCCSRRGDFVYGLLWVIDLRNSEFWDDRHRSADAILRPIEIQTKLCRLYQRGSIGIPATFMFEFGERDLLMESSSTTDHNVEYDAFHVLPRDVAPLQKFIDNIGPWDFPKYIVLAMSYFHQSYDDAELHVALLLLMICCEVLFNDGQAELRYKVSRGLAVLTGHTASRCKQIFDRTQELYVKRSHLVHRGDVKRIQEEDIQFLRDRLRASFKILMKRKWSKDELRARVNASGFGRPWRFEGSS